MRPLVILSLVQTGLLILLFGRVISLESDIAAQLERTPETAVADSFVNPFSANSSTSSHSSIDEESLRQIIRDELTSYAAASDQSQARQSATFDPAAAVENEYQLDRVGQQIEYFSSLGSISATEMSQLQVEIAKLDESGRREMLRRLTQAMNSGAIDGRF